MLLGQRTQYTHPNGMKTIYTYDTMNRLTKIDHTNGSGTTLKGWEYRLSPGGNILSIDNLLDSGGWDYGYDERDRLVQAIERNSTGFPATRFGYAYDAGDNMTAKTRTAYTAQLTDTFADNNYTANPAWTIGAGTWSAASGYMQNTASGSTWPNFRRSEVTSNFMLDLSYYKVDGGSQSFEWRNTGGTRVLVSLDDDKMRLRKNVSGVWSDLDINLGAASATGQWYDIRIISVGGAVDVLWGAQGAGLELVLRTGASPITTTSEFVFNSPMNKVVRFDNIRIASVTGTPDSTTFAYNDANEMTSMTENGTTTNFTYDDWGRTATKTRGSYTATYTYRYGQMLKRVDTNFPGETTTAYIHDGLLKRRYRGVDPSGANTITWWRHDLGWNALAEYAGTGGSSTALGTRQESYVWHGMTPLAEIASANPSTGTAAYYAHDHLGSTRGLYNASKTSVATTEYEPYGMMTSASTGSPAYQYTGKPWADEVDMYYFPYRYYNANAGRWLTRDPLGMVDGPNLYSYPLNPLSKWDPLGLFTESECYQMFNKCQADARAELVNAQNVSAVVVDVAAIIACLTSKNPYVCLIGGAIGTVYSIWSLMPSIHDYRRRMKQCTHLLDRCLESCDV